MAQTFLTIQEQIVSFLSTVAANGGSADPVTIADLTLNGINLVGLAINNAKRTAERAHDFEFCKVNASLNIGANGGNISSAITNFNVTVSGTLSPAAGGIYSAQGSYNGFPLYATIGGSFIIFYNGSAWVLSNAGFSPANYWSLTTASSNPSGSYAPTGSNTGTATVSNNSSGIIIKNIDNVMLPINGGFLPIEFLTQETWQERIRQQTGRQNYNPSFTLAQYGVSMDNPVAVQQGQTIYLYLPSQFTYPVTVQLDALQFMPDYVNDSDTDFFTEYAPEFLMWQGILECNKLTKSFVQRRDGNLDEGELEVFANQAFESLVQWDLSISANTGTPDILRFQPPATRQPSPAAK